MSRNPFSARRLEKVGIECEDNRRPLLRCMICTAEWQPNLASGGGLYRGWWRCPEGCNAHIKDINRAMLCPKCGSPTNTRTRDMDFGAAR